MKKNHNRFNHTKLIPLTAQMKEDIHLYCRDHNIDSESELVRQAILAYMDRDYQDNTLKLSSLKDIRENISQIKDMLSIVFNYLDLMHMNLLAYHPEIAEEYKAAASSSAKLRQEKFFSTFRERLKNDPSLFIKILHDYVTGSLDG